MTQATMQQVVVMGIWGRAGGSGIPSRVDSNPLVPNAACQCSSVDVHEDSNQCHP